MNAKPFGDLTADEQAVWMDSDPDSYFTAARAWAREVAKQEYERAIRRRRAEDLERLFRPFRGLRRADR